VTANVVLASLLKSLKVLSLNATITDSLLAVGRPIGTWLAALPELAMLTGDAVMLAMAAGLGSCTCTGPVPLPSGNEQTDQEACRYCWQLLLVPTCTVHAEQDDQ
jgi:hypothetical protein